MGLPYTLKPQEFEGNEKVNVKRNFSFIGQNWTKGCWIEHGHIYIKNSMV